MVSIPAEAAFQLLPEEKEDEPGKTAQQRQGRKLITGSANGTRQKEIKFCKGKKKKSQIPAAAEMAYAPDQKERSSEIGDACDKEQRQQQAGQAPSAFKVMIDGGKETFLSKDSHRSPVRFGYAQQFKKGGGIRQKDAVPVEMLFQGDEGVIGYDLTETGHFPLFSRFFIGKFFCIFEKLTVFLTDFFFFRFVGCAPGFRQDHGSILMDHGAGVGVDAPGSP